MKTTKDLRKELEELRKKNLEIRERKKLETQIFVEKHQTLIGVGEKVRKGMGVLSSKAKTSWDKMKEKELEKKKKLASQPHETYAERINKAMNNLAK